MSCVSSASLRISSRTDPSGLARACSRSTSRISNKGAMEYEKPSASSSRAPALSEYAVGHEPKIATPTAATATAVRLPRTVVAKTVPRGFTPVWKFSIARTRDSGTAKTVPLLLSIRSYARPVP